MSADSTDSSESVETRIVKEGLPLIMRWAFDHCIVKNYSVPAVDSTVSNSIIAKH